MPLPQTQGPSPFEDVLCSWCENHAPETTLSDGRIVCGKCAKDWAVCSLCRNPVLIASAASVEDGDGWAHVGCLGPNEDY